MTLSAVAQEPTALSTTIAARELVRKPHPPAQWQRKRCCRRLCPAFVTQPDVGGAMTTHARPDVGNARCQIRLNVAAVA